MTRIGARALELFDELIDLAETERAQRLHEVAMQDAALHAAVMDLLRADGDAAGWLEHSPAELIAARQTALQRDEADPAPDPRVGTRLGPWRIDRLIARGGIGSVYEAHRDDGQYQQRVALKCLRAELSGRERIAAFLTERQHLARLDHPGIAAVVDGGVEPQGQPWFAMRYVDGERIDRWCDRHRASVAQRVDLLIQAAQALAHAHAQGLAHGHIKPSNLLVGADGRVQLVDFGLSAAFVGLVGADEARDRSAAGPATDVYALGVLMYRLLSAQWPTPLHALGALIPGAIPGERQSMDRLLAQIADPQEQQRIADARGTAHLPALMRRLGGDLSAIALKAVAPQAQDRYASASEFAEDLRRWREHRPVDARPVGAWTRARLLLRRHPAAFGLVAMLLLAIVGSSILIYWQSQNTLREARASQAVSALFAATLGTATLSGLGAAPFSSQSLLQKTETELRKLDLRGQPLLLAHSLATLARGRATIGDYARAEALADEAQRALQGEPDDEGYVAATRIAMLNTRGRYAEAAAQAQAQLDELRGEGDRSSRRRSAGLGMELALAQWGLGHPPDALRSLEAALHSARTLGSGNEELLAQLLIQRSRFRFQFLDMTGARRDAQQAISLIDARNPVLADDARELLLEVSIRNQMHPDLALAQRILSGRRRTLGDRHPKTGMAWVLLAYAQFPPKTDPALARRNAAHGLTLVESAYGRNHPQYALALLNASRAIARGSMDNADQLREVLRIFDRTLGPSHALTIRARGILAARLQEQAPALARPSDIRESIALLHQNYEFNRKIGIPLTWDEVYLARALILHGRREDLPRAQALLRSADQGFARYFAPGDGRLPETGAYLGDVLRYLQGGRAEADIAFAAAIERYRDNDSFVARQALRDSLLYRALHAYETCDRDRALAFLDQVLAVDRLSLREQDVAPRESRGYLDALRRHDRMINTSGAYTIPAYALDEANARAASCRPR
ncbi:serine/threonine-protein kinase [Lysobacter silvisoli]|uniref:Serine/threonine protein kinase n=1 Tax=Lysobacter silvisoli TaxID=2293254 RepID=A0A371JWY3_9GAMM|nr:serine/threonine-protein kinase [Lysobacter silvisoli]RDZ26158.1 serine/threonine protein kinase [Lysobacter silvisoli]